MSGHEIRQTLTITFLVSRPVDKTLTISGNLKYEGIHAPNMKPYTQPQRPRTKPRQSCPYPYMWGDREPLYDMVLPMMSLVDVIILVHAGNLSKLQVSHSFFTSF
jgi:hypothetical protein